MNSQQLLLLNFIIVIILVLFFVFGRSSTKSSIKLKLRNTESEKPVNPALASAVPAAPKESKLTVMFMYNGHEWNAYEVLGVKPTSSFAEATQKYQELVKNGDVSSLEFYEHAYEVIKKHLKAPKM